MQADNRCTLVETAARRVRRGQMDLAVTALGIGAAHVHDGGLGQRQAITILGLDHSKSPFLTLHAIDASVRVEAWLWRAVRAGRAFKLGRARAGQSKVYGSDDSEEMDPLLSLHSTAQTLGLD